MLLPSCLAIIKCPAHQKTNTPISRGNDAADAVAKTAALKTNIQAVIAEDIEPPHADLHDVIIIESKVYEISVWLKRGTKKCTTGFSKDVWCGPHRHFVAPTLLPTLIKDVHGLEHCAQGGR